MPGILVLDFKELVGCGVGFLVIVYSFGVFCYLSYHLFLVLVTGAFTFTLPF